MKQLILFLSALVSLTACKKDASKSKTILLTEVSSGGAVTTRIQYSADNRATRYESYNGGAMNAYLNFEYDADGHISALSSYSMPGDIPAARVLFQCDGEGKVITYTSYSLSGPTPNIPSSITTRTYNAQDILTKLQSKDHSGNLIALQNYFYFPDGNLKELQVFKDANNQLWMSGKSVFSIPNGFYPKGVDQLRGLLGPEFMANLFSEAIHEYTYDQNGAIVTHRSRIMSGREFNDDGSVKKQVQTYKSIKPPEPEAVTNLGYEYVVQ